ncbi:MAG: polyribonucleotide nucleotidyltransferase [Pseudomonadota bacterium]
MFKVTKRQLEWAGKTLTLETGKFARQADGSVVATYGETTVLCTVVGQKKAKPDIDFFPLTVNYQEKTFATGKIPGGFFKREGRPSEKEVLTSRLIDRPIRPLFPDGFFNEVQVVCTVLSHDLENDSDIVALIGASAALTISGIPFLGPVGASRVGYIDGEYVINPTLSQLKDSKLELVVAGTEGSVLMVESEAQELSEEIMLAAVVAGHKAFQPVIEAIISLAEEAAKDAWELKATEGEEEVKAKLKTAGEEKLRAAFKMTAKQERSSSLDAIKSEICTPIIESGFSAALVNRLFKALESEVVRHDMVTTTKRIDGRSPTQVRQIVSEAGVLPKVHGSALFTRGETQALVVATLGTGTDEQMIDAITGEYRESFMLHYNFPPYSVGEVGRMGTPGRREIGHGKLAWRAIHPLMPNKGAFPYTIRVVSEITESNGSSSMATVCGTSLALMDAGVPLTRPVAGIAMGLIKEKEGFVILSDIMGDEDHLGDMDFKVAGTDQGITALQMDIKINGITSEIMQVALAQAKDVRVHILGEMAKALSTSRGDVNGNAPRITTLNVPKDKIREIIGTGGKVIREIVEKTGAKIDIDDNGVVSVSAVNQDQAQAAVDWINGIIAEVEIGKIYKGKVVKIMDFGAFVNFMSGKDGLVHISELADQRVAKVTDVVNEGDVVKVKVLDIEKGKVRLSMKVVDQATGQERQTQKAS